MNMRAVKSINNDKDKVDVKAEIAKFMESDVAGKGKVSQILKDIKEGKPIGGIGDIDCPTCKSGKDGHVHKLEKTEKGTLKCTGPECMNEYVLVNDKDVEYECENCHTPHVRPTSKEKLKDDKCPMCGLDAFVGRHKH